LLKGKNNPNYKNGAYIKESYCSCGNQKDHRATKCSSCSRKGLGKEKSINLWHLSKEKIEQAIINSESFLELATILNVSRQYITRKVRKYKLDYSHFRPSRGRFYTSKDILIKDSKFKRYAVIKSLILREDLLDYKCANCGLSALWNEKKLSLEIHHINGDSKDNRLENLQFLCPNCHSQTSSYKGKNMKKEKIEVGREVKNG
jgi:5-methylcytosine-specific restriction endonuclease McrA